MVLQRPIPRGLPDPPEDWPGSKPEWLIFWALQKLKIDFEYQTPRLGGRLSKGGVVIDFLIPSLSLAINVQSIYYHYRTNVQRTNDALQRVQLEGLGIIVIYIQEANALANPIFYVQEAIRGIEHN